MAALPAWLEVNSGAHEMVRSLPQGQSVQQALPEREGGQQAKEPHLPPTFSPHALCNYSATYGNPS